MRNSSFILFLFISVSLQWASSSFVELSEFGYSNLLVSIEEDVPASGCESLIQNLKETFAETSDLLCAASNKRGFFGDVVVMMPQSWMQVPECFKEVSKQLPWPRAYKADIKLGNKHPSYGSKPFTLQYGGCGNESLQIRISEDFLFNPKKGIELLHEWFHYRYGVFDESGISNDTLYPSSYNIYSKGDNPSLPTSCSNVPLVGQWNQSTWLMNEGDNENVNSSIMYTTQLSSIKLPCTHETHSKAPPTKQNMQCNSKSVAEVMLSHRDFISEPFTSCGKPTVTFVSNPLRGYHVILDVSSFMSECFEDAKFAISHFSWFLPDGAMFSLDSYGETNETVVSPMLVNRTSANKVIENIQKLQYQSNNSTTGLAFALNHAIELFHSGMEIIIITATPDGNLSEIIDNFRTELIAPRVIALKRHSMDAFSQLAREGGLYFIPDFNESNDVAFIRTRRTWLIDTLQSIFSRTFIYRSKVNEETRVLAQQQINGTFYVDGSSGVLIFAFYEFEKNYLFEFIQGSIYSSSGAYTCPIRQVPSLLGLFRASCNITEAGNWSYSITIETFGIAQVRLDVWMESEALKIETWTMAPVGSPVEMDQLVIYSLVTLGQRPVSNVELVAHIYGDNETQPLFYRLTENNAYDATVNDGIYSAIVTQLPKSSAFFSYVLEVSSTGFISSGLNENHASAGSVIQLKNPVNIGQFKRYVYGGSFYLAEHYNGQDIWAPERVKDLVVTGISWENLTFTLGWTAVIDDYGTSNKLIFNYRITLEDAITKAEEVFFVGDLSGNSLNKWITYAVKLPSANQSRQVYVRVYGIDLEGNIGSSSNIITIFIEAEKDGNVHEGFPPALFWTLIAIGCASFLLIIAVIAFFVLKKCAKRRKQNSAKTWITHGDRALSKKAKTESPKVNVFDNVSSCNSSFSSNWSTNSRASLELDDEVIVQQVTIEKHHTSNAEMRESDKETTSLESIVYAIPSITLTNGQSYSLPQKKLPPLPPPRRYFKEVSTTLPAQVDEETESSGSSIQYMAPSINGTWINSPLKKETIERYFAILGIDSEASLV